MLSRIIFVGFMNTKKAWKRILLWSLIGVLFPLNSFGQCDNTVFPDKCAGNLGSFLYIKTFALDASSRRSRNSEFSYVFSKDTKYLLLVCNENLPAGKIQIELSDTEHFLIASNYYEKSDKQSPYLEFTCSATGVYYIKTTIKGAKKGCGACILAISKN